MGLVGREDPLDRRAPTEPLGLAGHEDPLDRRAPTEPLGREAETGPQGLEVLQARPQLISGSGFSIELTSGILTSGPISG